MVRRLEVLKIINSLIKDWELAAENHRKAGGNENFWKADIYTYCAHRLKSAVLTQQSSGQETPVVVNHPPLCPKCMKCHHSEAGCR